MITAYNCMNIRDFCIKFIFYHNKRLKSIPPICKKTRRTIHFTHAEKNHNFKDSHLTYRI